MRIVKDVVFRTNPIQLAETTFFNERSYEETGEEIPII
jgi:hypothetical protein